MALKWSKIGPLEICSFFSSSSSFDVVFVCEKEEEDKADEEAVEVEVKEVYSVEIVECFECTCDVFFLLPSFTHTSTFLLQSFLNKAHTAALPV